MSGVGKGLEVFGSLIDPSTELCIVLYTAWEYSLMVSTKLKPPTPSQLNLLFLLFICLLFFLFIFFASIFSLFFNYCSHPVRALSLWPSHVPGEAGRRDHVASLTMTWMAMVAGPPLRGLGHGWRKGGRGRQKQNKEVRRWREWKGVGRMSAGNPVQSSLLLISGWEDILRSLGGFETERWNEGKGGVVA